MSGLFEKDIRLILQRKQALLIFLVMGIAFTFTMEGTFILGYLPFLAIILAVGTISYDEFENGYLFLMTLPIDRETYVKEKYVFCFVFGCIGWLFAAILYFVSQIMRGNPIILIDDIMGVCAFLFMIIILLSIMIPVQLKFGLEKSRIVTIVLMGIVMAVAYLMIKVFPNVVISLDSMNQGMIFGVFCIFSVIFCIISYLISCHIMKNKEF